MCAQKLLEQHLHFVVTKPFTMKKLFAITGGLAGACTVTLLHQMLKYTVPRIAPRMDLMGMEAMRKTRAYIGYAIPPEPELYKQTMIGDIVANSLYYSLASGDCTNLKGALLGAAAGAGAVKLPEHLGLNPANSNRTQTTKYLAFGIYLVGGIVAASTIRWLTKIAAAKA